MSKASQLVDEAKNVKKGLEAQKGMLEANLRQHEAKAEQLRHQLNALSGLSDRLDKYAPTTERGDCMCPHCAIVQGEQVAMTPISGNAREDAFLCKRCGYEFHDEQGA